MTSITTIGTFEVRQLQRERFISGKLWQEWYSKYPNLFDIDDVRLAESQAKLGYHFYEWLAAIMLYHTTGYLSLIEQYQCKNHKRKQEIIRQINSQSLSKAISYRSDNKNIQCPDLLVYTADLSDWFFCEVKGEDKLSYAQKIHFQAFADLIGKPIRLIQFKLIR
jgi:hypothetical protein